MGSQEQGKQSAEKAGNSQGSQQGGQQKQHEPSLVGKEDSGAKGAEGSKTPPLYHDNRPYVARFSADGRPIMIAYSQKETHVSVSYGLVESWTSEDGKRSVSLVEVRFSKDKAMSIMRQVANEGSTFAGPDMFHVVDQKDLGRVYLNVWQPVLLEKRLEFVYTDDTGHARTTELRNIDQIPDNDMPTTIRRAFEKHSKTKWNVTQTTDSITWRMPPSPPSTTTPSSTTKPPAA